MKTIAIDVRLIGRHRTGDEAVFRNLVRSVLELDRTNRYVLLTDLAGEEAKNALLPIIASEGTLPENARIVTLSARGKFSWNLFCVPLFLVRNKIDVFHTQYILPLFVPGRTSVVAH
ncbi:MAG: glycosyltransferase family 4 protein, partial [Candidatus Moranbacteria bacterium]|nr:glycosyltransferase family 4 protein [Candidatus Moranbacteria bacterium]